ncbi:MAG: hypothetical protein RIM72_21440 [Alphaproteobacteria bacterium]
MSRATKKFESSSDQMAKLKATEEYRLYKKHMFVSVLAVFLSTFSFNLLESIVGSREFAIFTTAVLSFIFIYSMIQSFKLASKMGMWNEAKRAKFLKDKKRNMY